jgi:hypothetical protein
MITAKETDTLRDILTYFQRSENPLRAAYLLVQKKYLEPVKRGRGREVFRIPDTELVLKIAHNDNGIKQNITEYEVVRRSGSEIAVDYAQVFKEGGVLITEFVAPVNEAYFESVADIDVDVYSALIEGFIRKRYLREDATFEGFEVVSAYDRRFADIFGNAIDRLTLDNVSVEDRHTFYFTVLKNPVIRETVRLIRQFNLLGEDFTLIDNWGRTDDKPLVVRDFGLKIDQL